MTQDERVHFKIALPIELKKRLEHESVENRRSLSAEIISRLERSLSQDVFDTKYIPRLEHLERENFERNRDLHKLGMTEEEAKQFVLAIFGVLDRFKANEKKLDKKD